MRNASEAEARRSDATARVAALAPVAARVQDLFGDLDLALLRGEDPMTVLSALKAAWRQFRDAALGT